MNQRVFIPLLVAMLILVATGAGRAGADPAPLAINYQGRLLNVLNRPVPDNNYQVIFKVCATPTGGELCTNIQIVSTQGGVFNAIVSHEYGSWAPVGSTLADVFRGSGMDSRYLEVTVEISPGNWETLAPRVELQSVPYALKAGDLIQASSDFTVQGDLMVDGTLYATCTNALTFQGYGLTSFVAKVFAPITNAYVAPWFDAHGQMSLQVTNNVIPMCNSGYRTVIGATYPLGGEATNNDVGLTVYGTVSMFGQWRDCTPVPNQQNTFSQDGYLLICIQGAPPGGASLVTFSAGYFANLYLANDVPHLLPLCRGMGWSLSASSNNIKVCQWLPIGLGANQ